MKKLIVLLLFAVSLHADPVDDLKQDVSNILPTMHGWCSREKALHFVDLVLQVQPKLCVEVGVFAGRSLFPVAATLRYLGNGLVVGIDSWNNDDCILNLDPIKDQSHVNWWSKVNLEKIYYSYLSMLSQQQLEDFCITLRTSSDIASQALGNIDILHLDGNRSEEGSKQDVALYLPKVRRGGYIWLNDSLLPERQSALDLLLESCDVVKLIENGNCLLLRKR